MLRHINVLSLDYLAGTNNMRESPTISGDRLPPCCNFTLTSVDNHHSSVIGGDRTPRLNVANDLYLIAFNNI